MKGVWLREVSFGPDLAESLLGLLREKYVKTAEGNKGIGQLAKILTAICRGEWLGLDGEFRKVQRVMPVLLVHDRLLESPGFGWFFAQEFERELEPDRKMRSGELLKGSRRVVPPLVLTIDDLELLEVSSEHFGIQESLADYSDAHPDRMQSFHHYLATSPKYSSRIYASRSVASAAIEAMGHAMKTLFGVDPEDIRRQSAV